MWDKLEVAERMLYTRLKQDFEAKSSCIGFKLTIFRLSKNGRNYDDINNKFGESVQNLLLLCRESGFLSINDEVISDFFKRHDPLEHDLGIDR